MIQHCSSKRMPQHVRTFLFQRANPCEVLLHDFSDLSRTHPSALIRKQKSSRLNHHPLCSQSQIFRQRTTWKPCVLMKNCILPQQGNVSFSDIPTGVMRKNYRSDHYANQWNREERRYMVMIDLITGFLGSGKPLWNISEISLWYGHLPVYGMVQAGISYYGVFITASSFYSKNLYFKNIWKKYYPGFALYTLCL